MVEEEIGKTSHDLNTTRTRVERIRQLQTEREKIFEDSIINRDD